MYVQDLERDILCHADSESSQTDISPTVRVAFIWRTGRSHPYHLTRHESSQTAPLSRTYISA